MIPYLSSARSSRAALIGLLALGAYTSAHACPCGCVKVCVDNLADRPAAAADVYTLDLRYDRIDQDERNSGAHAHFLALHRNLTATVETKFGDHAVALAIPRVDRVLRTNAPLPAVNTAQEVAALGDITLTTRFPWAWAGLTVIAGVKLPTGADDLTLNVPRRYLQPGTGSTDLILGLRRDYGAETDRLTGFWLLSGQGAVAHDANFRPGTTLSASAGVRGRITDALALSLQTTAMRQFRDLNTMAAAGYSAYAEDLESAAFSTHLAVGLTCKVSAGTSAYVYYSKPLNTVNKSDKVSGAEINAVHSTSIWTVGLTHAF